VPCFHVLNTHTQSFDAVCVWFFIYAANKLVKKLFYRRGGKPPPGDPLSQWKKPFLCTVFYPFRAQKETRQHANLACTLLQIIITFIEKRGTRFFTNNCVTIERYEESRHQPARKPRRGAEIILYVEWSEPPPLLLFDSKSELFDLCRREHFAL